jgi:hypothetical protein
MSVVHPTICAASAAQASYAKSNFSWSARLITVHAKKYCDCIDFQEKDIHITEVVSKDFFWDTLGSWRWWREIRRNLRVPICASLLFPTATSHVAEQR